MHSHVFSQHPGNITRKQGLSKTRNKPKSGVDDPKSPDKASPQKQTKLSWDEDKPPGDIAQYVNQTNVDFSAYQHFDFINYDSVSFFSNVVVFRSMFL